VFLTHSCSVILLSASQTVDELRASLTLACLSLNLPGNRCYRRRTATAATQQFAAREADRWKEGGNGDRGEQGRKPKGLSATVEKSPGMRNGRAGNLSLHEDTGRGRDRGRSVGRSAESAAFVWGPKWDELIPAECGRTVEGTGRGSGDGGGATAGRCEGQWMCGGLWKIARSSAPPSCPDNKSALSSFRAAGH